MPPAKAVEDIIETLAPLPQGRELRERVEILARKHFVSTATIYRWANESGVRWRKERADKGNGAVTREDAQNVGALLQVTRRLTNSISLPACDAVEILRDSGMLTNEVSTSTVLRALRDYSCSAKDITAPTPHRNLRAEHPNHMHQFDVTNCIQYFLDEKKGLGERDAEMTMYRNKVVKTAKTIKRELLRFVMVDKASGAFYFRYYYTSGEKAADGIEFMYHAWRPKSDERYRFHGVPRLLYVDKGAITHAHSCRNMLEALKVDLDSHMPGKPRAKGAVEGMMSYLLRFEAMLATRRPASLEELNSWAFDWTIYVNAVRDFRDTGSSRSALWSLIRPEQLRLCPDWETLSTVIRTAKERRLVNGDLIINYQGKQYRLPDSAQVQRHVTVCFNPYSYPTVEVETEAGEVFVLSPLERDAFNQFIDPGAVTIGEFKAHKHTPAQTAKTEMETVAAEWGINFKGTADKRRSIAPPVGHITPIKFFGEQADKVGNITYMDKRGTEVELEAKPEVRMIPLVKALDRIVELAGRRITKEEYAALSAHYGSAIPETEITETAARMRGGEVKPDRDDNTTNVGHWRARRA